MPELGKPTRKRKRDDSLRKAARAARYEKNVGATKRAARATTKKKVLGKGERAMGQAKKRFIGEAKRQDALMNRKRK
jgi:hypothetical protein